MSFVSVIVPTFNRASMIDRALASLSEQTYPDIEIVVIDDGSTDNTREVVARFEHTHAGPVVYWKQDNAGCASARNRGLQLANGELIAFLDSDDAWLPTAAESLADVLAESDADFAYSPAIEVLANGIERVNYPVAAGRPDSFAVEHFRRTNLRNGAFLFRRHVLSSVPGLDETLRHNEDSDFVQRMAVRFKATYCSTPTVKVYHHAENKSRDRVAIYEALIKSAQTVLEDNPAFRERLGELAEHRLRALRTRYVEELLIAGRFDEAHRAAGSMKSDLSIVVRLAAATRSTVPVKTRDRFAALRRVGTRKVKSILGSRASLASANDEDRSGRLA